MEFTFTVIKNRFGFEPMKKIQFTDSQFRDFEFWIYEKTVRFHYILEPISPSSIRYNRYGEKAIVADLKISEIENNLFPARLYDFDEAKNYLIKYFKYIEFT